MLDELQKTITNRLANRTRHQHILQPLLWLCGTFGIACIFGASRTEGLVQQELVVGAALCVLWTLGAYGYWSMKDPDRLQSESYRLSNRELSIIERRGIASKAGIIDDPEFLVLTESESVKALPLSVSEFTDDGGTNE